MFNPIYSPLKLYNYPSFQASSYNPRMHDYPNNYHFSIIKINMFYFSSNPLYQIYSLSQAYWLTLKQHIELTNLNPFIMSNTNLHLNIGIFYALDYPDMARAFQQEYRNLLIGYGVKANDIASFKPISDPNTYLVVAHNAETGEMISGMKLAVGAAHQPLPIVKTLQTITSQTLPFVKRFKADEVAETCACWVKKEYGSQRIPHLLMRAAVAYAYNIGVQRVCAFVNQYCLSVTTHVGCRHVTEMGDNGKYTYPNDRYITSVVCIDAVNLTTAPDDMKAQMLDMRTYSTVNIKEYRQRTDTTLHLEYRVPKTKGWERPAS